MRCPGLAMPWMGNEETGSREPGLVGWIWRGKLEMDKTRQRHPLETWHFLRSPHAPCHQTIEDPLKSGVEIHRSLLTR
jgi:hypothetical protein